MGSCKRSILLRTSFLKNQRNHSCEEATCFCDGFSSRICELGMTLVGHSYILCLASGGGTGESKRNIPTTETITVISIIREKKQSKRLAH